jgi:glutamyl-tRNA synthetase
MSTTANTPNTVVTPVVRFAPSPTGHLHIGGVRTALFNYFFARSQGGRLVLRIEDTDVLRSSKEMADEILRGLQWLGIQWDVGPIFQSGRFEIYKEAAYRLLNEKKAYRCFCTPEEIDERRHASGLKSRDEQIYKYDRKCLELTDRQVKEQVEKGVPYVIRFKVPEGATFFKDRLHKDMKVENVELEDFVILKSDKSPTYHLSVVVDDGEMNITDVIRGDDHISNTFKQVLLFKALDRKPPKYAHLPLIFGADKKKLSKRHGVTSVLEFKRAGYLPEAVITYLSQLSWLPPDGKKVFGIDELARQFKLSKVSKSSPVFDYDKLKFLNSRAIQQKSAGELVGLLNRDVEFNRRFGDIEVQRQEALVELVKPRMKTIEDFKKKFTLYLGERRDKATPSKETNDTTLNHPNHPNPPNHKNQINQIKHLKHLNYDNEDFRKLKQSENLDNAEIKKRINLLSEALAMVADDQFTAVVVEQELRDCADKNNLKAADLIHPSRFALTSETVSPSLFELFAFFGKAETLNRLSNLTIFLESSEA